MLFFRDLNGHHRDVEETDLAPTNRSNVAAQDWWFRPNTSPGGTRFPLASSTVSSFRRFLVPCPPQKSHRQVKSSFVQPTGLTPLTAICLRAQRSSCIKEHVQRGINRVCAVRRSAGCLFWISRSRARGGLAD